MRTTRVFLQPPSGRSLCSACYPTTPMSSGIPFLLLFLRFNISPVGSVHNFLSNFWIFFLFYLLLGFILNQFKVSFDSILGNVLPCLVTIYCLRSVFAIFLNNSRQQASNGSLFLGPFSVLDVLWQHQFTLSFVRLRTSDLTKNSHRTVSWLQTFVF